MPDPRFYPQPQPFLLKDILTLSGATLRAESNVDPETFQIANVAPLHTATASDLSFLDNKKYVEAFTASKAGACFVAPEHADKAPKGMVLLLSDMPYKAYALTAQRLYPEPSWSESSIAPSAIVHPTAIIGAQCRIEPNVVIGDNVTIGAKCWIKSGTVIESGVTLGDNVFVGSNVSLAYCVIGKGVRILPGVRIGQDGFGFAIDPSGHVPVPQLGRVLIGDRVWIGANTAIDRGAGPDTVIGDGCMIDNLVQIGHNVRIGKHVVIVAQVGVSGSVEIEDYAVLAGQVGVAGHLRIGRGARIAAQSGLMKDVAPGAEMMGSPAVPLKDYFRQVATLSQLAKKERG
mgnify:CR=1 FL=1